MQLELKCMGYLSVVVGEVFVSDHATPSSICYLYAYHSSDGFPTVIDSGCSHSVSVACVKPRVAAVPSDPQSQFRDASAGSLAQQLLDILNPLQLLLLIVHHTQRTRTEKKQHRSAIFSHTKQA